MQTEFCGACSGELHDHPVYRCFYECKQCGCFNKLPRYKYTDLPIAITPKGLTREAAEIDAIQYSPILKDIESYVPNKGKIWDVGSYIGGFLFLAKKNGWQVSGNDIQPEHVRYGREVYQIDLYEGHLEKLNIEKESYDAVVFHHGIEHVLNPISSMEKAIEMLKIDGIIYLCHPAMPSKEYLEKMADMSSSLGGHLYEWTYQSFEFFVNLFEELEIEKKICGSIDGRSKVAPAQTWVLRKKRCDGQF